jgi:hypothetical protein
MNGASLTEAALAYAAQGLPVFPCKATDKTPHVKGGFTAATTDAEQIRRWWGQWPGAMIGMPTGSPSGVWVLDVDDPATFEDACPVDLPATRRGDTGKGYHLHFRFQDGVRNKQRAANSPWPIPELPGAEVRGEGGYVILPPSRHPSGRVYRWANDDPPAPAPADLLRLVLQSKPPAMPAAPAPARPVATPASASSACHPYALAALEGECETIRKAGEGAQESTLNAAGLKVGHYVGSGALAFENARNRLLSAALAMPSYDPRNPWTADTLSAKIDRALRDGMAEPKTVPERMKFAPQPRHDPETGEVLDEAPAPPPDKWDEPVDLWANYGAPELPHGLLPKDIELFARSHGDVMGVDPAGLAMACLAVCSAAITDEIQLQVKQHDPSWRESARLWVGLVGAPSMKKSPILSAAARPLKRLDGNLMRTYMEKTRAYDALPAAERKQAERPRQERRVISDATVEAAQEVLRDSPRGVLSLQDELSGWFGQMDKYAPGKGSQADRGFWLQAYNGGSYSLNRIGRGASYIPNCSICLLGGIQPEPIRALAGDTTDDGLIQRLIPVVLRPGKVGRDVPSDGTLQGYERLIEGLELLRAGERPLMLDANARAVRERLEGQHLALSCDLEGVSPKMAAHLGKHDGLFARLCVLWHCIENNRGGLVPDTISGATAERVERFMVQFIRPSAVAFYAGLLGMSAGHEQLRDLAAWVVGTGAKEIKARDVQRAGQAFKHVTAEEVRLICEKLEAFGWGCWGEPGEKSNRKPFLVNPRVHAMFAERGKAEAERRAKAKALIRETVGA